MLSYIHKYTRTTVLVLCLASIVLSALWITIGLSFFPSDDALRHVAKAISGKDWQDILVVRDAFSMDSHPGWHFILEIFARISGYDNEVLLIISVCLLFLLFACTPVFLFKRPEAWIISLLIFTIFSWGAVLRLFYGRPYIFSMFLVLMFCYLWQRIRDKDRPYGELIAFTLIAALSTWIHGTWYLLILPLAALALAREWRVFGLMGPATIVGVLLGAVLTGKPFVFLHQMVYHAIKAMSDVNIQGQLVIEFWSFAGEPNVVIIVAGFLLWRGVRGQWSRSCVDNPVFYMVLLCWGLGFIAGRFWYDWGWPALAFWVAREIQLVLTTYMREFDWRRAALALAVSLVFFVAASNDRGGRWTKTAAAEWPVLTNPDHRPWLPEPGGIVYSPEMKVFYWLFFNNPHGQWRYILGFEPAWMPEEDLIVYRSIQLDSSGVIPWLERMTEKDRFIVTSKDQPSIIGMDWKEVTPRVWIGKFDFAGFEEDQGDLQDSSQSG